MSFYINSEDYDSGDRSNGIWNINRTLQGEYNVISLHIEDQIIPWMWEGVDTFSFRVSNGVDDYEFDVKIDASNGLLSNISTIANNIQTAIQAGFDNAENEDIGYARTVSHSINTSLNTITFNFNDNISILWGDSNSTINKAFNKNNTNQLNVNTFTISSIYINVYPKYLEYYITQSSTEYSTSHGTSPTLLVSTSDFEFTGQSFYIRNSVNFLTIKIYRTNINSDTVPLSDQWNLIFISS